MGEVRHDNCALEPIALHRRDKLPSVGRTRSAKVDWEAFAAVNAFEPEKRLVNEDIDQFEVSDVRRLDGGFDRPETGEDVLCRRLDLLNR